jgi:maltose O-acetyltransferase
VEAEADADTRRVRGSVLLREGLRFARMLRRRPRAALGRLRRYAGVLRATFLFRECEVGALVNAQAPVRVVPDGQIRLGDRVEFVRGVIPATVAAHRGAELVVGARTVVAPAARLEAWRSVRIGRRCMIASRVQVADRDHYGMAPIVIGDDVWLAHGVTIEPGVTIGDGSVVSAGSVVRRDVPPRSLAGGNPAVSVPLQKVDDPARRSALRPPQGPPHA